MKNFNQLRKNLSKNFFDFQQVKISLVGDSSTQLLTQAIKGYGYDFGINFEIQEINEELQESELRKASSEIIQFKPDYIVLFFSSQKLKNQFYGQNKAAKIKFAENHIKWIKNSLAILTKMLPAKIIYLNYPELNDSIYGNYANKTEVSFVYQLRKINFELMNLAIKFNNLFIGDSSALQNTYGKTFCFDPKLYVNANMVTSIDLLPLLAKNIGDIILSSNGIFKKCIILDLDNTLWGGVIGDDGLEKIEIGNLGIGKAFSEFQRWMKQLKERGIILVVCSHNDELIAKEPFEKHPDMLLHLDDITLFIANRKSKVDNLHHIQHTLNIGFDSMVFIDDSAFERDLIRTHIPEITVPELPEDPAEFLEYLQKLNLFETTILSVEDEKRTQKYKEEVERVVERMNFISEADFFKQLIMESTIEPFNKFNIPRVTQLLQRSNQFNLRTIRYNEDELENFSNSNDYITLTFTLKDKFGDNGLISVVIMEKKDNERYFIDTWVMSCRVLKRGLEKFILNVLVKSAKEKNCKKITGEYLSTPKNNLVKDLYLNLGFMKGRNEWIMNVDEYQEKATFIKEKMKSNVGR